jgi:peptidoglycan/LPS O-acetylase OafA/YrhL
VEEWFYLLFPVMLAVCARFVTRRKWAVLAPTVVFLVVPFLLRLITPTGSDWGMEHAVVVYRLDSIGFGVGLAYLKAYQPEWWTLLLRKPILYAGLVLTAFGAWAVGAASFENRVLSSGWRGAGLFELVNISAALLLPWFSEVRRLPQVALRFFTWVSVISYSLYLCNLPCTILVDKVLFHLGLNQFSWLRLALWIAGTFTIAPLTWRYVERPFMERREGTKPAETFGSSASVSES